MDKKLIVKKEKNKYFLYLNKNIYPRGLIQKAIKEEDWVKKISLTQGYFILELNTKNQENVLELANYLLYAKRSS